MPYSTATATAQNCFGKLFFFREKDEALCPYIGELSYILPGGENGRNKGVSFVNYNFKEEEG